MKPVVNELKLDRLVRKQGDIILHTLQKECVDINDGSYYLCALTHDVMRMLHSICARNLPQQEAKAAFKIAIDTVLLDYGMSTVIHEFVQQ